MAALFSRYRPPASTPNGLIVPADGDLSGNSLPDEFGSTAYAAQDDSDPLINTSDQDAKPRDFYSDSTGPAQQLDQSQSTTPSARQDAMDPAGKVPATAAAPPPTPQNASLNVPVPPPGMQGAPTVPPELQQAQKALGDYESMTPPSAPKQPKSVAGKIGSGVLDYLAARTGMPRHPLYGQQMAAYNTEKQDAASKIGLAEKVGNIESLSEARGMNAATRQQNAVTAAQRQGIVFLPQGQQAPEGFVQTVNPLAGSNSPYGTAVAYHDPHFGQFRIEGDLAKAAQVQPGWYPKETLDKAMDTARQLKISADGKVKVTPAWAQQHGIMNPAGPDGFVALPAQTVDTLGKPAAKTSVAEEQDSDVLGEWAAKHGKTMEQMTPADKNAARLDWKKRGGEQSNQIRLELHNNEQKPQGATNAALTNVPPHLVTAASNAYEKAGSEYAEAVQASTDMKSIIDLARSGNKVAYSYSPTLGVLTINAGHGVKRVNMPEIESYGAAGSAMDRLRGYLGKQVSGASIPPDVLRDMEAVHQTLGNNAAAKYQNKVKVINDSYGSQFKGVDLGGNAAQGGGNGMITVQVPGHPPGQIPANAKDAFLKKYPNAKVMNAQ